MSKMPKKKAKNKHGVYSSKVLLPGEKQADYEALRQSYFDEWVPDGVTEQYLVDDLCKLRWKKLRLERYDQVCLQQRKDKILLENNANKLIEELRGLAEEFSETESIEEVEGILPWLSAGYLWGGKKLKRKSANISRSFHPQPTSTTKNLPFMA
jgi:hypothetical protein